MKKKLFTLLTLLLCVCSGAWATVYETYTVSLNDGDTQSRTDGVTGKYFTVNSGGGYNTKYTGSYAGTSYTKGLKINSSSSITFTTAVISNITIVQSTAANGTNKFKLGGQSVEHSASGSITINETAVSYTMTENATNKYKEFIFTDVPATSDLTITHDKEIGLFFVKVEYTAALTVPIISASNATITATESGVEATQDIDVTGANLSGSTLTATLSPAVPGLSVTLASNTITAGAITTTATLHYTQTENAKGSTTLTLSDGTTSKNVTITYKSKVVPTEMVAISDDTTFELKNTGTGLDDVTSAEYVVLTDAGSEASFANNLAVKGVGTLNVGWRNDAIQAGFFKFKTTVPGKVTVKFSDVGSSGSRANRYANINGTRSTTCSNSSNTTVTSQAVFVEAGEVEIKGELEGDPFTDNQIRVFQIVFTAMPATVGDPITACGFNTYSSNYPVDLSTISGGTAYIATSVTDGKVVLEKCVGKVPAATGLMIAGTAGETFTINTTAETTTAPAGNLFVGMPNGGEVPVAASGYNYVFGWVETTNPGFYKVTNPEDLPTLGNRKAYLHTTDALGSTDARLALSFEDNETTGINNVNVNHNDDWYDLQGRRVAQPQKGLYIVNGKKVIVK